MESSTSLADIFSNRVKKERSPQLHLHAPVTTWSTGKESTTKLRPRFAINLATLPLDQLRKIYELLLPEERLSTVKTLGNRFNEICYEVFSEELREVGHSIYGQLENSRDDIANSPLSISIIKEIMFITSHWAFLRILFAEYHLLKNVYLDKGNYLPKTVVTFLLVDNLNEFNRLLKESEEGKLDWNFNTVNESLDRLRLLNNKVFEMFFMRCWKRKLDPLGPLLMKLLKYAFNSNYTVTVSHEEKAAFDSKCHISGQYDIADSTFTNCAPEFFSITMNKHRFLRLFLIFILNSIRVENFNNILKCRWECMEIAMNAGEEETEDKNWFEKNFPFVDSQPVVISERHINLPAGNKKIRRVYEKVGESLSNTPEWLGMRFDFQMCCYVVNVSQEFFKPKYLDSVVASARTNDLNDVEPPENVLPYEFKLDFKFYVKAKSQSKESQGLVEHCVFIRETEEDLQITKGKELII